MTVKYLVMKKPMRYWVPGYDFSAEIIRVYGNVLRNGDFLIISEKALAIALGYIYDESIIEESRITSLATRVVRELWSIIGTRCKLGEKTITMLRSIPLELLARHKQLSLSIGGLKHFLKPVSEAGIDTSNLPYSYVSLPLQMAEEIADQIRNEISSKLGKDVSVLIQDTDKTFLLDKLSLGLATRPSKVRGIIDLGVISYILGMCTHLFRAYPTPVAFSGPQISLRLLLNIARAAESSRGWGAGRNVVEMARRFNSGFEDVTWQMLMRENHFPAVIVRLRE